MQLSKLYHYYNFYIFILLILYTELMKIKPMD